SHRCSKDDMAVCRHSGCTRQEPACSSSFLRAKPLIVDLFTTNFVAKRGVTAALAYMQWRSFVTLAILPALALLLSLMVVISDLYARRVPNAWLWATLLVGAAWLLVAWIQGGGTPWLALLGLLIGLGALLPMYVFGWMGAGDVKFFA